MQFFDDLEKTHLSANTVFAAQRIKVKDIPGVYSTDSLSYMWEPETGGIAYIFRYGVIVFFDVDPKAQERLLETELKPYLHECVDDPFCVSESLDISIHPEKNDKVFFNRVELKSVTPAKLEILADVLAKSTILSYYEQEISHVFDVLDPVAQNLQTGQLAKPKLFKTYLKNIGLALTVQRNMAGKVEVREKPEVLWEQPAEINRFYARLEDEYEIVERHSALKEKLEVIHQTAETMIDLLHSRQSLRVEWYIVILIVFEIVLSLGEKLF